MISTKEFSPQNVDAQTVRAFRRVIYAYYQKHARDFPWRHTSQPYHILVSEVMLQQTQTQRVIEKYKEFIKAFPDLASLATAQVHQVLRVWQGLGYNRRALSLKKTAEIVVKEYGGKIPFEPEKLITLPGIGAATAASISAFGFNKPTIFIETNIRRVFIHFFFRNKKNVHDTDILPLVERTLDTSHPYKWYSALMDYGAMMKHIENPNRRSAHYTRQSPFEGSNRQIRGRILKVLLKEPLSEAAIMKQIGKANVQKNLVQLHQEGFLKKNGTKYSLA